MDPSRIHTRAEAIRLEIKKGIAGRAIKSIALRFSEHYCQIVVTFYGTHEQFVSSEITHGIGESSLEYWFIIRQAVRGLPPSTRTASASLLLQLDQIIACAV